MNFLTLENVTKSYGEKVLFKNINLYIDKGQKIGLIAKNGSGKTTLMRVIAGKEGSEGENAKISLRKEIRIGWLDQEPVFHPGLDILSAVFDDSNPLVRVVSRYERAQDRVIHKLSSRAEKHLRTFAGYRNRRRLALAIARI